MLIVGDLPYKHDIDKNFKVQSIDIVVSPENRERLFEELNLKEHRGKYVGPNTKRFEQDGETYHIFSTATCAYLQILVNQNFAFNSLKVATPAINYAFLWYMSRMRFVDPNMWLKVSKQVNKLKPYFYYTFRTRKNQFKLLSCGEKLATHYFTKLTYTTNPYEKIGFVKYDKYSLLIGIGATFQSPYKNLTLPGTVEFFNERIWNTLSTHQKKIAVLEMIYLHEISEIFVSEMYINKKYPPILKWKQLFIESLMDIVTSKRRDMDFIKQFILDNLEELETSFRPSLLSNFIKAETEQTITPLKNWLNENK